MRAFLALILAGCSLSLDLEGPPAYISLVLPDAASEAGVHDAVAPVALDASVDAASGNSAWVEGPPGAGLVHHPGGQGAVALADLPADGRAQIEVTAGDALTVVITEEVDGRPQTWLVTLTGIEPGDVLPVAHPAPAHRRLTSMRLRLDAPLDQATGYVVSNGCVELRCEDMNCAPWFEGRERSIAVTDRCITDEQVRSLSVALDRDGKRIAWAVAEDEVPAEDGGSQTTFSEWQNAWSEVRLAFDTEVQRVAMFARPFDRVAYGIGPSLSRPVEAGRAQASIRVPDGFAVQVEVGVDLLSDGVETARDRPARAWRRYFAEAPADVALRLDEEVPSLPTQLTLQVDFEGPRPGVIWLAAPAARDLARVELQWMVGGHQVTWMGHGPATAAAAQVPELPDSWASLRPPPGTEGTFAQLTLVRCDGVEGFRAHRRRPCPLYGAGLTAPQGRTVAWASALAQLPPPPPDAAVSDAPAADAGPP